MDMVQELRAKAYARNNLATDSRQKVIIENKTIIIEPADPTVFYVSYYDPAYIYGPWWYPAYPPHFWGPPGVSIGVGISYWPGLYFGFAFGAWSHFDWHRHYIHMDVDRRPRFVRHDRWISTPGRWRHSPEHRRGVTYRGESTARKYGQPPQRSKHFRRDTRELSEQQGRDSDRRVDDRNRIVPGKPGEDPKKMDRDRREREGAERQKKERERVDSDKQQKQQQQQIDRDKQAREGVEREQQQRRSDNVLKPVEDDGKDRPSNEGGKGGQQRGPGENSRDKGRSDDTDRGNNDNRGHNKR